MYRSRFLICILFLLTFSQVLHLTNAPASSHASKVPNSKLAIMTYVSDYEQEKKANALIQSIRKWGGHYKNNPIYVVLGDAKNFPCNSLRDKDVKLITVESFS